MSCPSRGRWDEMKSFGTVCGLYCKCRESRESFFTKNWVKVEIEISGNTHLLNGMTVVFDGIGKKETDEYSYK
jgi:hypothetical protein